MLELDADSCVLCPAYRSAAGACHQRRDGGKGKCHHEYDNMMVYEELAEPLIWLSPRPKPFSCVHVFFLPHQRSERLVRYSGLLITETCTERAFLRLSERSGVHCVDNPTQLLPQ